MPEKTMAFIKSTEGLEVDLRSRGNQPATRHIFESEHIDALNAAIACRRPLLLTGEPGTGKSQLARAAAAHLNCAFVPFVVDSRTESRDLLWHFDVVARLADAQLGTALSTDPMELRRELAVSNYVHPGPLWWAFDWLNAREQAGQVAQRLFDRDESEATEHLEPEQWDDGKWEKGCVILIDEIDKAELDVPNGLLEALGDGCFLPEGRKDRVFTQGIPPLVMVTSNKERTLPDAFLRRCLLLNLTLPEERDQLIETLTVRGRAHFRDLKDEVLKSAAGLVADDREAAQKAHHRPLPGQAEYIDLLRAVHEQGKTAKQREELLDIVRPYVVSKGLGPNA